MSVSYQWNREINPDFLNFFLDYRNTIDNFSEQTVYSDNSEIRSFLKFEKSYKLLKDISKYDEIKNLSDISIDFIENLDLPDIIQYIDFLTNIKELEQKTVTNKIISVRLFYRYLHRKLHLIKDNKIEYLEVPKYKCKTIVSLPLNECEKLINIIIDTKLEMWQRDYAIVVLFLNTGMRLSELCNAEMQKLDMINKKIVVLGKGGKEREIPLNDICISALEFYFKYRKEEKANVNNRKYIFLSKRFTKVGKRTLQEMLKKYLELAGLDTKKYSIHKLRHTCATLMLKNGVNIREIQEILGHENLSTTERYTHIDNEDLVKAVNKNPLNFSKSCNI